MRVFRYEVVAQWLRWWADDHGLNSQPHQAATVWPLSKALNSYLLSCINEINVRMDKGFYQMLEM